MTDRGKHSRRTGSQFYKDVLLLIAGILIVGALVFGGLSLLAGNSDPSATTATTSASTSTAADATTTSTTTPPSTSDAPATTAPPTTQPDSTATTAPTTTAPQVRPPSEITVVVLNSIGVTGLAGDLTETLGALGYQTIEAANYEPELEVTTVFHAEGFAGEARELANAVPDPATEVAPDPELASAQDVDLVVVIGLSYQG